MPSLLTLPPEILDAIFELFDDLAAILAMASSCKQFYGICNHPHMIFTLRHVLLDALGGNGVLAASLRTIGVEAIIHNYTLADADQVLNDIRALKEDKTGMPTTLKEYKMHFYRARIVQQLEVLFSRSRKDRFTRTTSRLTPEESERFRVALHRLWLLGLYTRTTGVVLDLCMNVDTRVPLFYSRYSAQDVYDIHYVLDWLDEQVDECLLHKDMHRFPGLYRFKSLFVGPCNVLKACLEPEKAEDHLRCDLQLSRDAWKDDVRLVFRMQLTISEELQPIIVLPDLECWGCGARPGHRLWNAANWDYLPCCIRPEMALESLPGYLKNNVFERTLLAHFLGITDSFGATFLRDDPHWKQTDTFAANLLATTTTHMNVPQILQAMCALPPLLNTEHRSYLQNSALSGVTNADLLCGRCLIDLVKDRLWVFWLDVKLHATPMEEKQNCPHGYNCTSQALNLKHAYDLNLSTCAPTPGTGPGSRRAPERESWQTARDVESVTDEGGVTLTEDDGALSAMQDDASLTPMPVSTMPH